MLTDQFGNPLTTTSAIARDAYVEAVDLFLSSNVGADEAFATAIAADEQFALAYVGAARTFQLNANLTMAQAMLAKAREVADTITDRETGHLEMLSALIWGDSKTAYSRARAHLLEYPRDVLVAQTCLGVFSLIGFSGEVGREAGHLALAETLAPHYGDHWWFLSALSFAQTEVGQIDKATQNIEKALAGNPRNANAAHHYAHLHYERGETDAGYAYLQDWLGDYDKRSILHGHLYWHLAVWALAKGDSGTMWDVVDAHVGPESSMGPALNRLSDTAAILYRAELVGVSVPQERWLALSQYAVDKFASPGLAFADVHAALAHAMAGNADAILRIMSDSKGPAAHNVQALAAAFEAISTQDWQAAIGHLVKTMSDHERIGGSRAQRDLIEHALVNALLRSGQTDEAGRLLQMRRPLTASEGLIKR